MLSHARLGFQGGVQDFGRDRAAGHQLDLQQRLSDEQISAADNSATSALSCCGEDRGPGIVDHINNDGGTVGYGIGNRVGRARDDGCDRKIGRRQLP